MKQGFDFSTPEILDWELEAIYQAFMRQEIIITKHAFDAADEEKHPLHCASRGDFSWACSG
jgi:hypothetical protein